VLRSVGAFPFKRIKIQAIDSFGIVVPIYAYRCSRCGHAQDVLQKISDPRLTTCPACGEETYEKQVTAAGFVLKGSGWYATDFKGGGQSSSSSSDSAGGSASGGTSSGSSSGNTPPASTST
jgi:putative FmdB family regulatory protein